MSRIRKAKFYCCYDGQTDDVLAIGTADECANILGIPLSSFYTRVWRCNKYDMSDARIYIITVDDDDNDI